MIHWNHKCPKCNHRKFSYFNDFNIRLCCNFYCSYLFWDFETWIIEQFKWLDNFKLGKEKMDVFHSEIS